MLRILSLSVRRVLATVGFSLATVGFSLTTASLASAQEYDWRAGLAQSGSVEMRIDAEYEVGKQRQVPIHFTMGVPYQQDSFATRTRFPEVEGNLGEMQFLSPEGALLEFVTVSFGTVGGDTPEERLERLFGVIDNQVYPSITPPETAQVLGGRATEIGGHPAIEYLSLFDNATHGPVAARIVGVISPNETDVVFFVQQTMRGRMGLGGPDDLATTFGGTMLSSLTFQAYRDASGNLVEF